LQEIQEQIIARQIKFEEKIREKKASKIPKNRNARKNGVRTNFLKNRGVSNKINNVLSLTAKTTP